MKIKGLNYNWFATPENGEEFSSAFVGYDNIVEIKQHCACGEGGKWYYDVIRSDGSLQRIFNPNQVFFVKEEQQ